MRSSHSLHLQGKSAMQSELMQCFSNTLWVHGFHLDGRFFQEKIKNNLTTHNKVEEELNFPEITLNKSQGMRGDVLV